jgi:hypothetical protein
MVSLAARRKRMGTHTALVSPETRQALKTPRAAAIAGIVFSLLVGICLVIFRVAFPTTPQEAQSWYSDEAGKRAVLFALQVAPFAGIAFLWFIAVIRDRMGAQEDRFFASVFLGSGLLFIAMFFAAIAVAVGLLSERAISGEMGQFGHNIMALLADFAVKMAAVFMMATATITLRTAILANWLGWLGYAIALVLLLGSGFLPWTELLFPLWVLLVSVHVLNASLHQQTAQGDPHPTGQLTPRTADDHGA